MANGFINFFKEPPSATLLQDKQEIKRKYTHYQWRMIIFLFLGYVISYIGRKNLSIAMPSISSMLGITKVELGIIGSVFYITYGIGKFVNGMLADKANVKTFFSTALLLAGLSIFGFAASSVAVGSVSVSTMILIMTFLWGANGWFQSMTFPPIAKSLTFWYAKRDRAIRWSAVSASHQIGTVACIAISTFAISNINWQWAFYFPALITIVGAIIMFFVLVDKPTSLGLPEVEYYREHLNSNVIDDITTEESFNNTSNEVKEKEIKEKKENKDKYTQLIKKNIFFNPTVWLLVIAYMFIYVVRTASEDWLYFFFIEARKNTTIVAGSKLGSAVLIGSLGTILIGIISDKVFKGKRTPVNLLFLGGLLLSLISLILTPIKFQNLDYVTAPLVNFFTSGLQNLVGLYIVEICVKEVAAAAVGFAGMVSYFGATASSIGMGWIVHNMGWTSSFIMWIVSTIIAIVLISLAAFYETKIKSRTSAI